VVEARGLVIVAIGLSISTIITHVVLNITLYSRLVIIGSINRIVFPI
jgi:hypothetical protein